MSEKFRNKAIILTPCCTDNGITAVDVPPRRSLIRYRFIKEMHECSEETFVTFLVAPQQEVTWKVKETIQQILEIESKINDNAIEY
jgi:hypothetical protein